MPIAQDKATCKFMLLKTRMQIYVPDIIKKKKNLTNQLKKTD